MRSRRARPWRAELVKWIGQEIRSPSRTSCANSRSCLRSRTRWVCSGPSEDLMVEKKNMNLVLISGFGGYEKHLKSNSEGFLRPSYDLLRCRPKPRHDPAALKLVTQLRCSSYPDRTQFVPSSYSVGTKLVQPPSAKAIAGRPPAEPACCGLRESLLQLQYLK